MAEWILIKFYIEFECENVLMIFNFNLNWTTRIIAIDGGLKTVYASVYLQQNANGYVKPLSPRWLAKAAIIKYEMTHHLLD